MQTIPLVPRPSILDRLSSPQDLGSELQGIDVRRMVAAIQRDLEDLLNARQTYQGLSCFPALRNSMLAFGLPDASQFDLESYTAKKRFLRTIESVIRNFEPRVSELRVHLLEGEKAEMGKMHFVIEAKLRLAPQPGIQFQSTLELGTGHYQLKPLDD